MGIAILLKILIVITAYLIGSIPTAYILFKIKKGDDIRKYGSGNVGGTNVIRTLGTSWGIITIILDVIKGFIPVLIAYLIYPGDLVLVAVTSVAAVLGHRFPVYIRFRGGKAIAITFGVIIGISVTSICVKSCMDEDTSNIYYPGYLGHSLCHIKDSIAGFYNSCCYDPCFFLSNKISVGHSNSRLFLGSLLLLQATGRISRGLSGVKKKKSKGKGHKWRSTSVRVKWAGGLMVLMR